ncbi:nitrogen permease regulator 2-domain-containing protein [Massariosphaeria phaeospora]|uniref:Nitrogen permease regulator 2-domain-containing protein n=1 Tax=Massariosphaeria phaeospora TaxID=100035 RepID=A0A7C8HYG1_9PLEO|nr:nitrogen permease regulator 2-domain-containing protein [Massariosphaeria phaeospora]
MPTRGIRAIFFTRFHHEKGSRVLHQVPEGSITPSPSPSPSALPTPLFDFDAVTTYLIPTQQFCDRLLTFCTNHYRVIGYPVCIREGKYSRNEFIFNFAVVIEEGVADWVAYGEVVRKLGRLLRGLEEQGGFLSREEGRVWDDDGGGGAGSGSGSGNGGVVGGSKVYALCEMVLEDLNNYAECMIPIDDSNTINLKLFPTRPPPPPIHAHQVPLLTLSLSSLTSPISSDLTMLRILPCINGINSVAHIAQLADTDLSLTRKAIQHLVYYGCLVLLDVFSFGAMYAPTAEIGGFIVDASVKEECARYVRVPRLSGGGGGLNLGSESSRTRDDRGSISSSTSTSQRSDTTTPVSVDFGSPVLNASTADDTALAIDHDTLITLYTRLRQGLPLRTWVLENVDLLHGIDVRRFITFGVIKGFLYRVHKYAVNTAAPLPPAPPTSLRSPSTAGTVADSSYRDEDQATVRGGGGTTVTFESHVQNQNQNQNQNQLQPHALPRHLSHKPSLASTAAGGPNERGVERERERERARGDDMARLDSLVSEDHRGDGGTAGGGGGGGGGLPLLRFLDGMHAFDEICMEFGLGEGVVEGKVRGVGDVVVVQR